ncbi:MazG-like family protein [Streptomyces sp. NPDC096198]|uniref:MazG-like family protein n=1 Tax=Streptomyces sp. NPDC096198 TaxID=3366080 RepID=UPI00380CD205
MDEPGRDVHNISTDPWESIGLLHAWLDARRPPDGADSLLLRVLKLSEEVGEVAQAVIGAMGRNPRKGVTHSWDDVQAELCDVVITALVALRTMTPDAREVFTAHLERVTARSLGAEGRREAGVAAGSGGAGSADAGSGAAGGAALGS